MNDALADEVNPPPPTPPARAEPTGIPDMVLSALFFSVMSLLVKLAGERIPAVEIVLVRAFVSLVLSAWFIRRAGLSWRGNRPGLLVLRGLFGLGGLICFFWAITQLDLSSVTVIHYTNPLWTALLAALLLGEAFRRSHAMGLLLALVGVICVAQPTFIFGGGGQLPLDAVLVALLGSIFAAAAYVTVRKLGASEAPLVVVLYFPLIAVPLIAPFAIAQWVWPSAIEWLILIGVGVATQIAQIFMTRGLHRFTAGRATAVGYLQVVFATGWGIVIFGKVPGPLAIVGALLVLVGAWLATRTQKAPSARRESNPGMESGTRDSE